MNKRGLHWLILVIIVAGINPNQRVEAVQERHVFLPIIMVPGEPPIINPGPPGEPVLQWAYGGCENGDCDNGWYSSPLIVDFDNNGTQEVVAARESVWFLNGADGAQIFGPEFPLLGRAWPSVVCADFNNDNYNEIAIADGSGGVYLLGLFSPNYVQYLWYKDLDNCAGATCFEVRSMAADDLDHDGVPELVTASMNHQNQWRVYDGDGSEYQGDWPQHEFDSSTNGYTGSCLNSNIAMGDLDGDSRGEIIGTSDAHSIIAFEDDGTQVRASVVFGQNSDNTSRYWSAVGVNVPLENDLEDYSACESGSQQVNFANSAPTISDVNDDGVDEIVVIGNVYNCDEPYQYVYQSPFIFNYDRTRWVNGNYDWSASPGYVPGMEPIAQTIDEIESSQPNPVVIDLDGNDEMEIVFPSFDGKMHAYWLDKNEHESWPISVYEEGNPYLSYASEPIFVDFERDGYAEVIFTTWTGKGSMAWGSLVIANWDGTILYEVGLPAGEEGETWSGGMAAPTIGNIDSDSDLEVIINSAHGGVLAYEIPNSASAKIIWGTGRGGYLRNGRSGE